MNDNGSSDIIGSDRLDFVPYSIFIITERSNFVIHWVLLLRALFLRALDFRAPSFIVNKGCVIGKKNVASEFLLSISAYFTFAHTPFTRTIYFCHLHVKEVPSVLTVFLPKFEGDFKKSNYSPDLHCTG